MADLNCQILSDDFPTFDLSFKIIVIGDQGVGKSCLSIKASRNYFEDFYSPTVGFEFVSFNVKVADKNIKLQIWDTCGQEVYRSLISSFYRSASLAIIVYSIDNEESFNNIENWMKLATGNTNSIILNFLVGNKSDKEEERKVDKKKAEEFALKNDLIFLETSAKNNNNVTKLFYYFTFKLIDYFTKNKDKYIYDDSNKISTNSEEIQTSKKKEKKCSC